MLSPVTDDLAEKALARLGVLPAAQQMKEAR